MAETTENTEIKLGGEAQGALGIGSDPKANLKALPGAYQRQKEVYQSKLQGIQKSRAEETKPLQAELEAMEKKRDAVEDVPPAHAGLIPPPKFEPKQLSEGFSLMLGLASFAGLASRQPLTAALNNMTGMMKGLQEGNKENFEREYKEWDTNFKQAEAKYKDELSAYQKILGNMNKSIDQKMREIRDVGLKYDNKIVVAEATSENPAQMIKLTESLGKLSHQMATEAQGWERIHLAQQKHEESKAKVAAAAGGSGVPDKMDQAAAISMAINNKAPSGLYAMGDKAGRERMRKAAVAFMDEHDITPQEWAMVSNAATPLKKALGDITTKEANISAIQTRLIGHIDRLIELSEKAGFKSDVTKINELNVWAGQNTNNPDAVNLAAQIALVGNEFAKLSSPTSNAMLPEGARNESRELFSPGYLPKTLRGLGDVVEYDAKIAKKAFKEETRSILDQMVSPLNSSTKKSDGPAPKNAKGWTLHTDANGNKAYVSPDGKNFEEVK